MTLHIVSGRFPPRLVPLSPPAAGPVAEERVGVAGYVGLTTSGDLPPGEFVTGFSVGDAPAGPAEFDEEITIQVNTRWGSARAMDLVLAMFRALTPDIILDGKPVEIVHPQSDNVVRFPGKPRDADKGVIELGHGVSPFDGAA